MVDHQQQRFGRSEEHSSDHMIRRIITRAVIAIAAASVLIALYVISFYWIMDEYPAFNDDYEIEFWYSFKYSENTIIKDRYGLSTAIPTVHFLNYFYYPMELLLIHRGKSYDRRNVHLPFDVEWR